MNLGSYKTRVFSPEDLEAIEKYITFFNSVISKLNLHFDLSSLTNENLEQKLDKLKYPQLRAIVQCSSALKGLGNISFKIETCCEYINMKHLIDEATKKSQSIKISLEELKDILNNQYSKYAKTHVAYSVEDVLPFSKFGEFFQEHFKIEDMSKEKLNFFDLKNFFNQVKMNLIVSKTDILERIRKNPDDLINLNEVKSTDPKSLLLIQKEFFKMLSMEYFEITPQNGKISHSEIITPPHPLAKKIGMTSRDNFIVTLSLNPINKSPAKSGDVFYNNKFPFVVYGDQESTKLNLFYQIRLNKEESINLEMPIYFSIIKARLKF